MTTGGHSFPIPPGDPMGQKLQHHQRTARPLGDENFLTDPNQTPHMAAAEIAKGFAVSQATMMNKAKAIREGLDLIPLHPD